MKFYTFFSLYSDEILMMIKSHTKNCFRTTLKCLKKFYEGLSPLFEASLCEICKNWGFCWPVFSCISTYSWILSLYRKIQVSENLYSCLYYTVLCNKSVHVFFADMHAEPYETSKLLLHKKWSFPFSISLMMICRWTCLTS